MTNLFVIKLILWGLYFLVECLKKNKKNNIHLNELEDEEEVIVNYSNRKHPAADNLRW
jgi:hypothetical protein